MKSRETLETVEEHRTPDGVMHYVEVLKTPVTDSRGEIIGVQALFWDVTERKKAEVALRQAEEKYHSIFENAVEGIFQSTPDGHFLSANPTLARIYGYEDPQELIEHLNNI